MRVPTPVSLGNSSPSTRKEVWRLDGSENKTDWRRIANDVENGRRWREEERESGLLGIRRDRRKVEHCVENVTIRERVDSRALPTSERWHDGRSSGHETWRDIKWSSKWGPEDKEKETRAEKRTEVWRRKILLLMNNRFLAATIQIQIVNQILVINGGHAIEWKLILVDQLPIGLHLDLNWGEDGWRAHLQDLALGEDDLMLLE
ncbi:GYF domain-containing protein [Quillaja saponaria]|nr:GYF domain-containing protein [Quillaja saponaria]